MKKHSIKKYLPQLILFLVLIIGAGTAYFLSQTSQDIRQQANTNSLKVDLTLNPNSIQISPGEVATIPLTYNAHQAHLTAAEINLNYNAPLIEIMEVIPADLPVVLSEPKRNLSIDGGGESILYTKFSFGAPTSSGGITGTGTLAQLKVKLKTSNTANIFINDTSQIAVIEKDDNSIGLKTSNTIAAAIIQASPSPTSSSTPSPLPSPWPSPSYTPSPTPSPISLSGYCQPCNDSLPPSTPNSRCVEGLVCRRETPECFITDNGSRVCPMIAPGSPGVCVRPGETQAACDEPISLAGKSFPNDGRINLQSLSLNEKLLPFQQQIFAKTVTLDEADPLVADSYGEPGYGEFFIFYPAPGMNLEILAKELDIAAEGSYIEMALYGPDKNKITQAGTRIQNFSASRLPHYLAVYTFDHKQGRAEITITNEQRIHNYFYTKRIDQEMKPLNNGEKLGRKAADFFLQVPQINSISNEYVFYTAQIDNKLQGFVPRIRIAQICPATNQAQPLAVGVRKFNNPNQDSIRELQMKIYPQHSGIATRAAYFSPGYEYQIKLEYPDGQEQNVSFSTLSPSGLMADLNDDNAVDISDYSILVSELMETNYRLISDLSCDGIVDISDYSLLIQNFSL